MRTLTQRIAAAGLSPAVAQTFADGLRELAGADGEATGEEALLLDRLLEELHSVRAVSAAPFEALWPHAELFLTACLYVAVVDGHYGVEEARRLSSFAHRLGLSAHRLAELEGRIFRELRRRAAELPAAPYDLPTDPPTEVLSGARVDPEVDTASREIPQAAVHESPLHESPVHESPELEFPELEHTISRAPVVPPSALSTPAADLERTLPSSGEPLPDLPTGAMAPLTGELPVYGADPVELTDAPSPSPAMRAAGPGDETISRTRGPRPIRKPGGSAMFRRPGPMPLVTGSTPLDPPAHLQGAAEDDVENTEQTEPQPPDGSA